MKLYFRKNTLSLFVSSFFAILAVLMVLATFIEIEGRQDLGAQRSPAYSSPGDAVMVYRQDGVTIDHKNISVMYYEPFSGDKTIPPGLVKNLKPGTVAISSILRSSEQEISAKYGQVSAYISPDALLWDEEPLIYVRPINGNAFRQAGLEERGIFPASGFGAERDSFISMGSALFEYNIVALWFLEILLVLSVVLISLFQTRKRFQNAIAPQLLILERLGAPPTRIVKCRLRAVGQPVGWALGICIVLSTWILIAPIRLPFNGFVTRPELYRENLGMIVITLVAAVTVLIATLVLPSKTRVVSVSTRKRIGTKLEWLSIILLLLGLAIVAFTTRLLHLPDVSDVFVFVLYSGILLVLLGIPGVLALVLQFVVSIIRPRFKNCLDGIMLNWADRHSFRVMLQGAAFSIFLVAGAIVALLYVAVSTPQISIKGDNSAITINSGCRAVTASNCIKDLTSEVVSRSDEDAVVVLVPDFSNDELSPAIVSGDTSTLRRDFDSSQLRLLLDVTQSTEIDHLATLSLEEIPEKGSADLFIMARSNELQLSTYNNLPANSDSILPSVEWYGEGNEAAQEVFIYHARWVLWFAGLGFFIMMFTLSQATIAEQHFESMKLAPLIALNGQARQVAKAMRTRRIVTSITAIFLTWLLGVAVSTPFVIAGDGDYPISYFFILSVVFIAFQLVEQNLAENSLIKAARTWKPGDPYND